MNQIKKFNIDDFNMLDTGDIFINIWSYSHNLKKVCGKKCELCNIYRKYCTKIIKSRWQDDWGKFPQVMKKIYNNDDDFFINLALYSSADKHLIVEDLKIIARSNNLVTA